MDLNQFATEPSSPRWEIHRSLREATGAGTDGSSSMLESLDGELLDSRAAVLEKATRQLERMCSEIDTTQSLLKLLKVWSTVSRQGDLELQPNLLAWAQCSGALEHAVKSHHNDAVELLLSRGLVPNERAISAAVDVAQDTHDTSTLALLIKGGWDINQVYNQVRPSILSIVLQDEALVKWCLSVGADPNAAAPTNRTVLHLAASLGTFESVKTLISAGARFQRPCLSDDIIAHAVESHGKYNDRFPIIEFLLDQGADIDAFYDQNWNPEFPWGLEMIIGRQTALHLAVGKGDRQMVEMLVRRGADLGKLMWNYSTSLDVLHGLAKGVNWKTKVKWIDAIEYARHLGFKDIVEVLRTSSRL